MKRMVSAGVNIEVLYSDHDHRLILGVADADRARTVAEVREGTTPAPLTDCTA